jgi:polysaccharide biosynthesis PFTS motif protein
MRLFMKILGVSRLMAHRARIRLMRVMRGYRRLKAAGALGRVAAVKEALTATPACKPSDALRFLGLESAQAELAVRQFLLVRRVTTGLGEALLESVGNHDAPVYFALPKKWREVLRSQGFPVAERASALLWAGFCVLYIANGLLTVFKLALANAAGLVGAKGMPPGRYVYFDALGTGNLPSDGIDRDNHNIVNWYLGWAQRAPDINQVCHSVANAGTRFAGSIPVVSMRSPLLTIDSRAASARFFLWGVVSGCAALLGLLRGNWWQALMLGEAAKAAQVRFQEPALLARDYMFHNSNWIYRPLWTYEAERKGARIIFYFYSTNCEKFKRAGAYPSLAYGWQAMAWPLYLVWDEYQADFVRRAVGDAAHINVAGSISFNSGTSLPKDLPEHAIAVFDVQPMRDSIYQPLGSDFEYYVPGNANHFLTDIHSATSSIGQTMLLKRKRNVESKVHPSYANTINALSKSDNYLEMDPDAAATALIAKCSGVVSAPFTSTALIGRDLGKPSIYYDPHGLCEKDDRAAHGIPIVSGRVELLAWLAALESEPGQSCLNH